MQSYNHITMLNKVRQDTLLRLADSALTLKTYLQKYYSLEISEMQSESLFKSARAVQEKITSQRKAKQLAAA